MSETKEKYKSMTYSQLAQVYGVSYTTFRKWLKEFLPHLLPRKNRVLTPRQVEEIRNELG
ncbi:MAG: helix-turn-helix domain-containing protein [Lentimicrobiaceae bacterium]|nr:helix-turn-helix domain-containing protein [Lentimicrobiaceae bacterium]